MAEALTNAVKHSGTSSVAVWLMREADRLVVLVDDDGHGGARVDAGTGLKGLKDRVEAFGGSFAIASEPEGGTRVRVELPCAS